MSNLHYLYLFFLGLFTPVPGNFGEGSETQAEQVIQTVEDTEGKVSVANCNVFPDCPND